MGLFARRSRPCLGAMPCPVHAGRWLAQYRAQGPGYQGQCSGVQPSPTPSRSLSTRACAHFLTCARGHAYSQISYLALGTVHATLTSRSLRWKIAFGAIGLIITLVGDSLALCLRLGDPSLWRLPAINVCVPFIAGFAVAQAVRRGQQRPSAKLGNSERHALSARSATEVGITSHTMTTAADGATSDAHVKAEQSFGGGFWQGVVWLASGA